MNGLGETSIEQSVTSNEQISVGSISNTDENISNNMNTDLCILNILGVDGTGKGHYICFPKNKYKNEADQALNESDIGFNSMNRNNLKSSIGINYTSKVAIIKDYHVSQDIEISRMFANISGVQRSLRRKNAIGRIRLSDVRQNSYELVNNFISKTASSQ